MVRTSELPAALATATKGSRPDLERSVGIALAHRSSGADRHRTVGFDGSKAARCMRFTDMFYVTPNV